MEEGEEGERVAMAERTTTDKAKNHLYYQLCNIGRLFLTACVRPVYVCGATHPVTPTLGNVSPIKRFEILNRTHVLVFFFAAHDERAPEKAGTVALGGGR